MALTQISTDGVKDNAVTAGKIPANAVGSSELADNAVDTAAIQDDAVTADKIADNAINADRIVNGGVNTAKLADQSVTLAKLVHGTSSNDGKFLRANNGADPTFETVNTDLVSDTSPQLGGDLASNGNDILMADTDKIKCGNGPDFEMFHNGSSNNTEINHTNNNSHLQITSNRLKLMNYDGPETYIDCISNGAVELYHNNSKKLETTSGGTTVTGTLTATQFTYASHPGHTAFTGNGSTTTITISSGHNVNSVLVVYNGLVLTPTTDYTINGTTMTLQFTPPTNAQVIVRYLPN